jgi:diadenosine tetraphosphate (Ap4A) HIT family hydrolase
VSPDVEIPCPLCEVIAGRGTMPLDRPWYRRGSAVVLPARGHLVRGHLLICSAEHYPTLLLSPAEVIEDVPALATAVQDKLLEAFGLDSFVFEHGVTGPNKEDLGCSIDHVHLHALPLPQPLLALVAEWLEHFTVLEPAGFPYPARYLLGRVGRHGEWVVSPPEQVIARRHFLKLLDEHLGRTSRYDELLITSDDLIAETYAALQPDRSRRVYVRSGRPDT